MADRSNEVIAVSVLFIILPWLTVGLRVYTRAFLTKTWGKDDSCMLVSVMLFSIYIPFQIVAAVHGTGRHRWDLSAHDAKVALLSTYICELVYVLTTCALKFAIALFYLRVAMSRLHILCIKILMMGTAFFGLVYFLIALLQCLPISEFWDNHPASSKCLEHAATLGLTYALAGLNVVADCAFAILPLFIVWDLRVKKKTKILTAAILAFAAIGIIGTAIRIGYIHGIVDGPDFLYATTDVAIWSTTEPGIGIIAGNIATLRPLFRHCLWRMGLSDAPRHRRGRFSGNQRNDRNRRGHQRSLSPSDLVPTDLGGTMSTQVHASKPVINQDVTRPPRILVTDDTDDTDESYTLNDYIVQTVSIKQEVEGPPRLHVRNSFRNSFTRGSIFSASKYRIPD